MSTRNRTTKKARETTSHEANYERPRPLPMSDVDKFIADLDFKAPAAVMPPRLKHSVNSNSSQKPKGSPQVTDSSQTRKMLLIRLGEVLDEVCCLRRPRPKEPTTKEWSEVTTKEWSEAREMLLSSLSRIQSNIEHLQRLQRLDGGIR